jgi:predicted CoA-substrate-specific enzyme activase
MTLTLGVDIGSTTSKSVLLDGKGAILHHDVIPTGSNGREAAESLRARARCAVPEAPSGTVATGYGRALVPYADRTVTEITCHARGVRHLHPDAAMVIDLGGQDSKVIRLDASGRVEDFAMNDRCAAGTGSFLDVIAARFNMTLEELARTHEGNPTPMEISSMCVVFAETEVVSLLSQGHALKDVLAGVHRAIAKRVATLIRQVGLATPVFFSGGVALNETIRREIEAVIGVPLPAAGHPQLTAALGAARIAAGA